MKKIITLLAVIGMFGFQGCTGPEGPPGEDGVLNEVYEVEKINFIANSYSVLIPLSPAIYTSDMVLVYRLAGSTNSGADIWKSLPETYFYSDGTRYFGYNFDFNINGVNIFLEADNLGTVSSSFRLDQIFRIVILPGYLSYPKTSKGSSGKVANKVDLSDYNAVIKAYNIDDSNVKQLN